MEQKKLLHTLARHDQFIRRVTRMLAAGERGEELPSDAEFHTDEIQSLDSSATDILIEITGFVPNEMEWLPPGRFAFKHGYAKPGQWTWLRSYQQGLQRSKNYLAIYLTSTTEVHMGDKISVGAAHVVMGSNAQARDISTHGSVSLGSHRPEELLCLADELSALRKEMRKESDPDDSQHDIELGAVAQAEKAARVGDQAGALTHLKSVGKWCLDIAAKIGVNVATEAIKQSTGLGK